ncbi:hypothetical protein HDV57DRAFT_368472 [Trichoderma longibrachiatum]|uniref:Uncharacterized protein n=1 Tax=Trichoderma longibrachiatum ATCC 18648 TaxID=983965 RepID=A0A2T4BXI2_TRILO|nr:hypothetical protein M440DRAFT_1057638 [Trichoderma longibrachiatum ATCC 18648]
MHLQLQGASFKPPCISDDAAATPVSWVTHDAKASSTRLSSAVDGTSETRPAARLAPKALSSAKTRATVLPPWPWSNPPRRQPTPKLLRIELFPRQTGRPAKLPPHLHVLPTKSRRCIPCVCATGVIMRVRSVPRHLPSNTTDAHGCTMGSPPHRQHRLRCSTVLS